MYMNKRFYTRDCNRCNAELRCRKEVDPDECQKHEVPREGFNIAELTLTHPTSLNKALSVLPFKASLQWYLK